MQQNSQKNSVFQNIKLRIYFFFSVKRITLYRYCEDVSMLYKKSVLADGLVFASPFLFLSRRACKTTVITTRHYHYCYCARDDTKRSHTSLKVICYVVYAYMCITNIVLVKYWNYLLFKNKTVIIKSDAV